MTNQSNFQEHLIIFDENIEHSDEVNVLNRDGVRILHQFSSRMVTVASNIPEDALCKLLPPTAKLIYKDENTQEIVDDYNLSEAELNALKAFNLQRSFKKKTQDIKIDLAKIEGTAIEPDTFPGLKSAKKTLPFGAPTNERMINSIGVGIVFIGGSGDYAFSSQEKQIIRAATRKACTELALLESDAKVLWKHKEYDVQIDIEPWKGARWPGLNRDFYISGVDAALMKKDSGHIYLFNGKNCVRYTDSNLELNTGYPKAISEEWPNLPSEFKDGIDAALWRDNDQTIYFFNGDEYVLYSFTGASSPIKIAKGWPNLPTNFQQGIDAALMRKESGQIYFFKGNEYVRFSDVSAGIDPGYPRLIEGNWLGLPEDFQKGINAALWRESNGKTYFFKKVSSKECAEYVRFSSISVGMDTTYPRPVGLNYWETAHLFLDPTMETLGFPIHDDSYYKFNAELQNTLDTHWAFCIFFTKYPTTWFAKAASPKCVIYNRDEFVTDELNFSKVIAHEMAHIFGALDEYIGNCDQKSSAFFHVSNINSVNCHIGLHSECMMDGWNFKMCDYTKWHVGWKAFLTHIDAAWQDTNDKLYLLSNDKVIRLSSVTSGRDNGYPKDIKENWSMLPPNFQDNIDATFRRESNGKIYFFKGDQYIRFSNGNSEIDEGYPKPIVGNWPRLPEEFQEGIDAALMRKGTGQIYFFKGNECVRFSKVSAGVDEGYPKLISEEWLGLPQDFQDGIDAALTDKDNKTYLFKGTRYACFEHVHGSMYSSYPRDINDTWIPFPKTIGYNYLEISRPPSYIQQVTVIRALPGMEPTGYATFPEATDDCLKPQIVYDAQWQNNGSSTRTLNIESNIPFKPNRDAYVFVKLSGYSRADYQPMHTVNLNLKGISNGQNINIPVEMSFSRDDYYGIYYWGSFKPENQSLANYDVIMEFEGIDNYVRYELRDPPGHELDSDPSTKAYADLDDPPLYLFKNYEPGVDRNHKLAIGQIVDQLDDDNLEPNDSFDLAKEISLVTGEGEGIVTKKFSELALSTSHDVDYFLIEYESSLADDNCTLLDVERSVVSEILGVYINKYPPMLGIEVYTENNDCTDLALYNSVEAVTNHFPRTNKVVLYNPTKMAFVDKKVFLAVRNSNHSDQGAFRYDAVFSYAHAHFLIRGGQGNLGLEVQRVLLGRLYEMLDLVRPGEIFEKEPQVVIQASVEIMLDKETRPTLQEILEQDVTAILANDLANMAKVTKDFGMRSETEKLFKASLALFSEQRDLKKSLFVAKQLEELYVDLEDHKRVEGVRSMMKQMLPH